MAARRLLIVMLVLLGISSVIAIVVPEPNRDDPAPEGSVTGTTGVSGATGSEGATGETGTAGTTGATGVTGKVDPTPAAVPGVANRTVSLDSKRPATIEARTGSRMVLTVESKAGSEVEIEGLGLAGFADPYAPAVFDIIFPAKPGKFRVVVPGEKPAATITTTG